MASLSVKYACTLLCLMSLCAAGTVQADSAYDSYAAMSGSEVLTPEDLQLLQELNRRNHSRRTDPVLSGMVQRPGEVVFAFGSSRPQILCQVLELTDIAFEPGEILQSVQIGDAARWSVESALSGTGSMAVQHLVIKPFDSGIATSLLVTTDRRSYHLALKSSLSGFMPQVRFVYPSEQTKALSIQAAQQAAYRERNTVQGTGVTVDELDFAYEISGDEALKPLRVFNDGRRTFLEFAEFKGGRMPALLVVNQAGGLFSDDRQALVNYRVQGRRFVVDGVPEHMRLVLGEDSEATVTDIERQEVRS